VKGACAVTHIAIVEANRLGLRLLQRAKARGLEVSFIRSASAHMYAVTPETQAIFDTLDRVIEVPDATRIETLGPALAALHGAHPVDLLISVYEYAVDAATRVAADLGIPATNPQAVATARHKYKMRQTTQAAGLSVGHFAQAKDIDAVPAALERVGCPAVIKPVSSAESIMAQIVPEAAAVPGALRNLRDEWAATPASVQARISPDFVVESYFDGPLVSGEIVKNAHGTQGLIVSERIQARHDPTIELGTILPATLSSVDRAAVLDCAAQAVDALGLDIGIFHVEQILTPNGPRLVEVNPRLMGGSMPFLYDYLTGGFVHDILLDTHLGRPVQLPTIPPKTHVFSLRLQTLEPGTVAAVPGLDDAATEGFEILQYDAYCAPGQAVGAEAVVGRFYIRTHDPDRLRPRVAALLAACEARLGVPLAR